MNEMKVTNNAAEAHFKTLNMLLKDIYKPSLFKFCERLKELEMVKYTEWIDKSSKFLLEQNIPFENNKCTFSKNFLNKMVHNYKIFHNNLIITDSIEITNFLKDLKLQSMQQTIEFIEECGFGIHENVNMINKN